MSVFYLILTESILFSSVICLENLIVECSLYYKSQFPQIIFLLVQNKCIFFAKFGQIYMSLDINTMWHQGPVALCGITEVAG